ncbi:uncharacterized protein LODBEIA_P56550 [Lodderomyces beijingensis]|uniref:Uncharacterized protein n=1 Tax=Lodderomyces beijingensis TaxID=1775926 RepID=A0ABP0ZVV4_9ASCO
MPPRKSAATPIFVNKEDGNFREALKLYDQKQYKKALKLVDVNLKKNASHAESLALKGCILFHTGNKEDAATYIDKASKKDPNNYLVDHLVGLYYRALEDYVEAAKWLQAANENGSPNKPILRDLSFMQAQNRDYKNLKDSRQQFLEHAPGFRANWTGLAVAQHLCKDYAGAVSTLTKIEGIIKEHLTASDMYEHNECILYKNQIIAESGNFAKALEELESDKDSIKDQLSYLEYKGKYLLLLGRKEEASKVYRMLLKRNPDCVHYYSLLETCLGSTSKTPEERLKLYEKLTKFYPRSDPPKFIPLTFLPSDSPEFEKKCGDYIIPQLLRGVPATFVNVKPLYQSPKKLEIIEQIVLDFLEHEAPKQPNPTVTVWCYYYLAQHYLYKKDLKLAQKYIDLAIDHSPTLVELYIVKARITKHEGDLEQASEIMNEGRLLDLQDRFVNSKATKYMLRANRINEAIDCISLFTKLDEGAVNGCKDLHMMQVSWVLVESAEAYHRLYHQLKKQLQESDFEKESEEYEEAVENVEIHRALALKRFNSIVKLYKTFFNDQYDFHSYCLRRGTPRDYIDTIRWEDKIKSTPIYTRALKGLAEIHFEIYQQQQEKIDGDQLDDVKIKMKSGSKKQKKAKVQFNKKKAGLIAKVESEKDDEDPLGLKMLHDLEASDVIEKLSELFQPLSEEAPRLILTWDVLYQIYAIQGKYVLALQAIKNLEKILNRTGDKKKKQIGDKVINLSQISHKDSGANQAIVKVVEKGLNSAFPEFEKLSLEEFTATYSQ